MKTANPKSKHEIIQSWELQGANGGPRMYSADEVINAYEKGASDGKEQTSQLIRKQFNENMEKSANVAKKAADLMKARGVTGLSQHLRVDSLYDFTVMITVSEQDFLNDSFNIVYHDFEDLEKNSKAEFYSVSIQVIIKSKGFNKKAMISDGFIYNLIQ